MRLAAPSHPLTCHKKIGGAGEDREQSPRGQKAGACGATLGSTGRPSPATPGSTGRPSPATPGSAGRPSPATPGLTGRPSPATLGLTGQPSIWGRMRSTSAAHTFAHPIVATCGLRAGSLTWTATVSRKLSGRPGVNRPRQVEDLGPTGYQGGHLPGGPVSRSQPPRKWRLRRRYPIGSAAGDYSHVARSEAASMEVNRGDSRSLMDTRARHIPTFRLIGRPVPEAFQAGGSVPSLHDCLGPVRRVKARPLRGRFASLDTSASA